MLFRSTRETERTGKRLTQRDFVLGLIEKALDEAEQATVGSEAEDDMSEELAEDNGSEAAPEA